MGAGRWAWAAGPPPTPRSPGTTPALVLSTPASLEPMLGGFRECDR